MTKAETSLARIFAIYEDVGCGRRDLIRTELEGEELAREFLGLIPVVTQYPCGPPVEPLTVHPGFLNDLAHSQKGRERGPTNTH